MNWDAIGAIAELIGAVAVVATLIFLAFQLRANTKSNRATARSATVGWSSSFARSLYQDPTSFKQYQQVMDDPDSADEDVRARVLFFVFEITKMQEVTYLQFRDGVLDQEIWDTAKTQISSNLPRPGYRMFWTALRNLYAQSFRTVVDEMIATEDGT